MLRICRICRREDVLETARRPPILGVREDVEDSAGEIQDTETVLEALVCGRWINQPRQRQLVNMTEPLKGARIDDFTLVGRKDDESVDWITKFIVFLRHGGMVAVALPCG